MKLKIKQNILMEHLNYVIKGISSKNLIPILNCIKFELTEDGLYLMSTDNEIAIKTFIEKILRILIQQVKLLFREDIFMILLENYQMN